MWWLVITHRTTKWIRSDFQILWGLILIIKQHIYTLNEQCWLNLTEKSLKIIDGLICCQHTAGRLLSDLTFLWQDSLFLLSLTHTDTQFLGCHFTQVTQLIEQQHNFKAVGITTQERWNPLSMATLFTQPYCHLFLSLTLTAAAEGNTTTKHIGHTGQRNWGGKHVVFKMLNTSIWSSGIIKGRRDVKIFCLSQQKPHCSFKRKCGDICLHQDPMSPLTEAGENTDSWMTSSGRGNIHISHRMLKEKQAHWNEWLAIKITRFPTHFLCFGILAFISFEFEGQSATNKI